MVKRILNRPVRDGYSIWRCILVVLVIAMTSIFSGCASSPRAFGGHVTVAPNTNPDYKGRPSPVVVKIFQLRDVKSFQEADFFSLYDSASEVLGDDLISAEERELQPGVSYGYKASVDPEASFIAVLAAFRDIENAQWRATTELPKKGFFDFMRGRTLQINLSDLSVSASLLAKGTF